MTVTSEQALAWRERTEILVAVGLMPRRTLNSRTVDHYRRDMRELDEHGQPVWGRCDQGITVGTDGGLYNGNHRMEALSKEPGLARVFYVRLNTPIAEALEIASNADQGRVRTISSMLEMDRSLTNPNLPASEAKARQETFRCFEDIFISNAGKKEHKGYRDLRSFITKKVVVEAFSPLWALRQDTDITERKARGRLKGAVPLASFILNYPVAPERTVEYYLQFLSAATSTNEDVGIKSPIGILRKFFETEQVSSASNRPSALRLATLMVHRLLHGYYDQRPAQKPRAKEVDTEGRRITMLLFEHFRPAFPVALLPATSSI